MNTKTTYSEQELVTSLQQHDSQSFSYLYDNYASALYGIINQIVADKETANDVLQDVFVNIWKKIESYDSSKGRLFTWMLNIARNASIDKVRSRPYQDSMKNQPFPDNVHSIGNYSIKPNVEDVGLRKVLTKLKN